MSASQAASAGRGFSNIAETCARWRQRRHLRRQHKAMNYKVFDGGQPALTSPAFQSLCWWVTLPQKLDWHQQSTGHKRSENYSDRLHLPRLRSNARTKSWPR